jgi:hypothetical protein
MQVTPAILTDAFAVLQEQVNIAVQVYLLF